MKITANKYRLNFLLLFILLFFFASNCPAQIERETRAVWVATNHRLDWPPKTFEPDKQKKSLEEIFDTIKSKNLNTVFFQIRSNGTVLFKSSLDPFSSYITGEVGGDPSYDPLEYAVELAHERGLEIHAWINCLNAFTSNGNGIPNNKDHICQRKPEWIIEDIRDGVKTYWLDPGLPEVREYISDMISEMVENYDVDGVHLDYIRYPGKNFDDEFSFGLYNGGMTRDDWRRNNITELIALINKKIKSEKPYVKLGAAPIGVYKNQKGMYAWEGYNEVYQDSREWLRRGALDYVVPQIYWGLTENPRFDLISKEWIDHASGRCVVLGIGAYKENVRSEIEKMIQYSRSINSGGVAFFRYESIKDYNFKNFGYKTYPSSMAWLDGIYPESPQNLICKKENSDSIFFNWEIKKTPANDSICYYALYNLPHPNSELLPDYLLDIIPADKSSLKIALKPTRINYYFTLKSVSKLWNESIVSSNVAEIKYDELSSFADFDNGNTNPILLKENTNVYKIILSGTANDKIEISTADKDQKNILIEKDVSPGMNIISLPQDFSGSRSIKIQYKFSRRMVELIL
jgi:uncharacterized lipoprotein YddW (UPF0748 family)